MSTTLIGSIVLLAAVVGTMLSYNANKGLPFVPTIGVTAEVPDAARLVEAGSEVRIGGARVGIVDRVEAVPPTRERAAYARVGLKLDAGQRDLPTDTRVAIRPRSLLGAKYVDLIPGRGRERLEDGDVLPLRQAVPVVEISDTFEVFGRRTARALQRGVTSLGDALAGRGSALSSTFDDLQRALRPAGRVLTALVAPSTDLAGLLRGAAATGEALAPVAAPLGAAVDGAAGTMGALDRAGAALPEGVRELGATAREGTPALRRLAPVLADAAAIARDLRPAAGELPRVARVVADGLETTTPVLRDVPALRAPLATTLTTLERVAADPAAPSALRRLTATVVSVRRTLGVLGPAQRSCNVVGLFTRNSGEILGGGDENGNWLTFQFLLGDQETVLQSPKLSRHAHVNPLPREDATECESGNEPFAAEGMTLGNPAGVQRGADRTAPLPGSRERADAVGLWHQGPVR